MRSRTVGSLMAVVALAVAGCGSDDGDGAATTNGSGAKAGKKVDVAYISYANTDYVQAEVAGVKKAVTPGGGSVKVFSADFDPQKQLKQCQDAITSGRYDAIVLSPVDPATGVPCVKAAAAAKLPVATVEQAVGPDPYSVKPQLDGVVAVASIPLATQVREALGLVQGACGAADPCKVIAEVATASDRFTNDIVKGVESGGGGKIKVVQKVIGQYDPSVTAKVMPDAMNAHKDANVLLSAADSTAVAAFPAIKEAGLSGKIKVIGNGGSHQGADAVKAGTMFGTIANWPEQTGALLAKGLIESVNGQTVTRPSINVLEVDTPGLITKDTVGDFAAEWGAQ